MLYLMFTPLWGQSSGNSRVVLLSAGIFRGSSLCLLSPDFIDELCADYLLFSYLKQTHQQFVVQPNGSAQYY